MVPARREQTLLSDLVIHVTGARPHFLKAARVVRALAARDVPRTLLHTELHSDERLSEAFFQLIRRSPTRT